MATVRQDCSSLSKKVDEISHSSEVPSKYIISEIEIPPNIIEPIITSKQDRPGIYELIEFFINNKFGTSSVFRSSQQQVTYQCMPKEQQEEVDKLISNIFIIFHLSKLISLFYFLEEFVKIKNSWFRVNCIKKTTDPVVFRRNVLSGWRTKKSM